MQKYPVEKRYWRRAQFDQPHIDKFHVMRAEVLRRVRLPANDGGRPGFGAVYTTGPHRDCVLTLGIWNWPQIQPGTFSVALGAKFFVDDPICLGPNASPAMRLAVARSFAQVANETFDADDVRFEPRFVEIVAAGPDKPAGLRPGKSHDILTVDLFVGVPVPRIIDALTKIEFEWYINQGCYECAADDYLRMRIWHRAERVNAARTMLGFDLPRIVVPALSALRRRVEPLNDAYWNGEWTPSYDGPRTLRNHAIRVRATGRTAAS